MTPNGFFYKKARRSARVFTLIEILAAMAVLSILMLMLFMFFGSAQKAWSNSSNEAENFEAARVIFDVIQRDLQGAVARANDVPGSNIEFNFISVTELSFVTASDDTAPNTLAEVAYRFDNVNHTFSRAARVGPSSAWNPYGHRPVFASFSAVNDSVGPLADGVVGIGFACATGGVATGTTDTTLPDTVSLWVILLDSKSLATYNQLPGTDSTDPKASFLRKHSRTFSTTIFLGGRQ